ncbi:hypothetical protein COCON_G00086480 [Conger conger]|uniref:Uncharacterized protein n=1 Tax=Conger conger TaxID=82655 RepID=A0A9Q1DK75_CONCO|nr:hypothetical protein COCON_G00086480 [Conger conger]
MQKNRTSRSSSFLSTERRRFSLEHPEAELVGVATPSCAVRRRFSGPLLLPPLSRRHSTQDARRHPDPDPPRSPAPLARGGTRSLEAVGDPAHNKAHREGAGLAKAPKHLWRQPRTHIRIQQRNHSDSDRYLYGKAVGKRHPRLKKARMSWPAPLQKW